MQLLVILVVIKLIVQINLFKIIYNNVQETYVRFGAYGNIIPEHLEYVASEVIVPMLVGLKYSWKCSAGYFLTDKCYEDMQTFLIKSYLSILAEHGLYILSVTCNGTSTNLNTFKYL